MSELTRKSIDAPPPRTFRETDGQSAIGQLSICVVGLGYIGLPTASILASQGHRVTGVDVAASVVETVNRGEIHIHEPHLDQLVARVVAQGNLRATDTPVPADVFFICVPTPITSTRAPDVSYVRQAARAIRPFVRRGSLIILESTCPPGTTNTVIAGEAVPDELQIGRDVFVAYCPERVIPGHILAEAVENDRVVGGATEECTRRAKRFYDSFVTGEVWPTDCVTAEMVKLVENAYRDVNIAFANELAMLADPLEVSPFEIIELANKHPRVNILSPGPGVGGHCISVDPWFLIHGAPQRTPLMRTAREVNLRRPNQVVETIEKLVRQRHLKTIACLGITYKADVDDLRESPSLEIVRQLQQMGIAEVLACDPLVPQVRVPDVPLYPLEDVLARGQACVLLTDHRQFRELRPSALEGKFLIDTRGTWQNLRATHRQDPQSRLPRSTWPTRSAG